MMDYYECPVCHGNALADISHARRLANEAGIVSEHADPGGREIRFSDGRKLRLSDQCNSCDARRIREFLDRRAG